ncbi:MAG: hypothetical protein AVDCRST_MAG17-1973 [uncultured Solirubrobacterales bacterium]|uniref:DUF3105 domain-containing protein n=1 Tax=uncultured Solirubrobacterales bacterium TaxID=768556 RepID=A0A6J4T142_9ACTN|nr:MAG: hypothetical protein AVDCRST_MAG17-1973 [uncultured Solirubrobacterales bacterium]
MASRKDEKARLRAEREERERTAAAGARRKRLVGYGIAGVLGLGALVAVLVVALAGGSGGPGGGGGGGDGAQAAAPVDPADVASSPIPPRRVTDLAQAAKASGCTTRSFRSEGDDHVTSSVTYKSSPAQSGNHDPIPLEDGIYTDAPRTENAVHALEHGRILIEYKPSVSEETRGQLKALFDEDPYHMVILPNAKMPYEVAAVAWTEVLGCQRANPQMFDAIRAFKERHRDRAPEFVP